MSPGWDLLLNLLSRPQQQLKWWESKEVMRITNAETKSRRAALS
jgi:hypothetical protein